MAMSSPHKRKQLISDFFPSKQTTAARAYLRHKAPLPQEAPVPGLTVIGSFISEHEEQRLLDFLYDSEKCHWRTDLSRRCMHFGGTYCLYTPMKTTRKKLPDDESQPELESGPPPKPEVLQAPQMPHELSWLLEKFISQEIFPPGQIPQYCIVNEYKGSQGISAHVENFSFGEPVVGLSLLDPIHMRFHELKNKDGGSVRSGKAARAEKTGRKEDVQLDRRSLCVMRGESRWKWQHEIVRSGKGRGPEWKRVSLTFRWKKES